ncbi:MAG: sigma-54 interaction domain-containing protein [Halanaerobiales bacterium]
MNKNNITIVAEHTNTADFQYEELKNLFGDYININKCCFERDNVPLMINSDLVLITDTAKFEKVNECIQDGNEIIVINRTITKKGLKKLKNLSSGTRAMLVNASINTAVNTVSTIYKLGVRHLRLTPVYPEINKIPDINLAITPGEVEYVPEMVEEIIDIGDRVLDISTIMDIIVKFDLSDILDEPYFRDYLERIVPSSFGLEKFMGKTNRLESQLDIVLNLLDVGLISVNSAGIINSINERAEKILERSKRKLIGKDAQKLIPEIPFEKVLRQSDSINEKIIKINDWDVVLTLEPIRKYKTTYGAVAVIKKYINTEERQQRLRAQLINKGHKADYTFRDIAGKSEKIKKAKKIAKRMAGSSSTVLLIGESGTGKELFAQAIHNKSDRKNYQFVAINCAALPENLLESELFGYVKGAFTGANKEGKPGLFELAHKGTLFLDEISEIPPKLQTRLLRVIEEREVMRIGGERVINIDVRLIAASNKDLKKMVEKGDFREDLYYRLSVLPLKIPSLRKRKEDIIPLINTLKEELGVDFKLSSEALEVFLQHNWKGNVRELRNYIEYFSNLDKNKIKTEDFPFTLREEFTQDVILDKRERELYEQFKKSVKNDLKYYYFILNELKICQEKKLKAGRRSLAKKAKEKEYNLSEMEIRNILKELEDFGLVNIGRGRQGSKITEFGKKVLDIIQTG